MGKAQATKEFILNDVWWDKIAYIIDFTEPIYNMVRVCDTDESTLHLVYEMWDSMTKKVKASIYRHEGKYLNDTSISPFYNVIYSILIDRWTKSCTPLHCLAHSLNPWYYSDEWLCEDPNRVSPHEDEVISTQRNNCFRKLFKTVKERKKVKIEYANFSSKSNSFDSFDSIEDRWVLDPKSWWVTHGSPAPLQKLDLKLLVQPSSSSYCERNWSTYSFIHSLKRSKLIPKRAEDLVYVLTNLRLLGRKCEEYKETSTKMWDIGGDAWESFDGVGNLEVASLSLDEPNLEATLFTNDSEGGDDIDTIPIS
ncbi:uncharacterized protein LOC131649701 [Vicia villosa]|uniref:uncharacterized protein LOC131649701 n=1 Tax=Vicia villosa TaxID=3911 RepID=UPI00273C4696|nr:uncharacterized protein LOC131649701 [Vicia villosa]